MSDLYAILKTIGLNHEQIESALSDVPTETPYLLDREEDIGNYLGSIAPSLSAEAKGQLARAIHDHTTGTERVFATAASALMAEHGMRPNSSVFLFAGDAGTALNPGNAYSLFPRIGGKLQTTPFLFTKSMSFLRLTSNPEDCAVGWTLLANSFGFQNERAKPYPYDLGLKVFAHDIDPENTPLASLVRRSPDNDVPFTGSVIVDATSAQPFHGLGLNYYDTECAVRYKNWLDNLGDFDFGSLARALADEMASRRRLTVRRPPVAAAPTTRQPDLRGKLNLGGRLRF